MHVEMIVQPIEIALTRPPFFPRRIRTVRCRYQAVANGPWSGSVMEESGILMITVGNSLGFVCLIYTYTPWGVRAANHTKPN